MILYKKSISRGHEMVLILIKQKREIKPQIEASKHLTKCKLYFQMLEGSSLHIWLHVLACIERTSEKAEL